MIVYGSPHADPPDGDLSSLEVSILIQNHGKAQLGKENLQEDTAFPSPAVSRGDLSLFCCVQSRAPRTITPTQTCLIPWRKESAEGTCGDAPRSTPLPLPWQVRLV